MLIQIGLINLFFSPYYYKAATEFLSLLADQGQKNKQLSSVADS